MNQNHLKPFILICTWISCNWLVARFLFLSDTCFLKWDLSFEDHSFQTFVKDSISKNKTSGQKLGHQNVIGSTLFTLNNKWRCHTMSLLLHRPIRGIEKVYTYRWTTNALELTTSTSFWYSFTIIVSAFWLHLVHATYLILTMQPISSYSCNLFHHIHATYFILFMQPISSCSCNLILSSFCWTAVNHWWCPFLSHHCMAKQL